MSTGGERGRRPVGTQESDVTCKEGRGSVDVGHETWFVAPKSEVGSGLTTKTSPSPFSTVHLILHPSLSTPSSGSADLFSIMTSLTRVFTGDLVDDCARVSNAGLYDLDQRTRPPGGRFGRV